MDEFLSWQEKHENATNTLINMVCIETHSYFSYASYRTVPLDKYQPEITLSWLRFVWVLGISLVALIYVGSFKLGVAFKWAKCDLMNKEDPNLTTVYFEFNGSFY